MKFTEVLKGIYHVQLSRPRLNYMFVRFQEYYESPKFAGVKGFSREEFWQYCRKEGKGSYAEWGGFNVPSRVFKPFHEGYFDPLTADEKLLLEKVDAVPYSRFYVVGTPDAFDVKKSAVAKHEAMHGLFYTNPDYRQAALQIVQTIPKRKKEQLEDWLDEMGYHPRVFDDEIQAYLGSEKEAKDLADDGISISSLKKQEKTLRNLFDTYYDKLKV